MIEEGGREYRGVFDVFIDADTWTGLRVILAQIRPPRLLASWPPYRHCTWPRITVIEARGRVILPPDERSSVEVAGGPSGSA